MGKTYLGDGVYVEWNPRREMFVLTTEDGISAQNTIYMEPPVVAALIRFVSNFSTSGGVS